MNSLLGFFAFFLVLSQQVASQWIYDVWQTTWDRTDSFKYTNLSPSPINFTKPGAVGSADIVVDDTKLYQQIDGFGAALTDSAALTLNNLKNADANSYHQLLEYLFDPTDGANSAGLSYIRIPIGATDLSAKAYTYDDVSGDKSLAHFSINSAPSYVFSVLDDIKAINNVLKLHFVPWSPPGWMKSSGSIKGGNFLSQYTQTYAEYLLKTVQAWNGKGFPVHAIGIQNEPMNSNPTYPTCIFTADQEAAVAKALRTLLNNNGFTGVKIVGYEHNWDNTAYPESVVASANLQNEDNVVDGVSFHCYAGEVSAQTNFHNSKPKDDVYFTECAGTVGSDFWQDIKWQTSNLWIGAPNNWARSALMWSLAAAPDGGPLLPGTSSCGDGCRGVITVSGTKWTPNQEFYGLAQANKAVLPRDAGGPWGQRIGVSVGGSEDWALVVSAFQTQRKNTTDWDRYSLVVMNWNDGGDNGWNPKPVQSTIEFRGQQAKFTFPVGVTTLWWYAPPRTSTNYGRNIARHHARRAGGLHPHHNHAIRDDTFSS